MKILQLGKFYPVRGGVEKVMYDLTLGLSARGMDCDMMCVALEGGDSVIHVNRHANLICCRSLAKLAATMISPSMISELNKRCSGYDIIHVHHPDPMACLALFMSGYRGKVVLHWHSDILKQKHLLRFYAPLQNWLIHRADAIVGTTPVYIEESPYLEDVIGKTCCIPIGVSPVPYNKEDVDNILEKYHGKKVIFTLGRLIEYKGHTTLIEAAGYLPDDCIVLIGGAGPLRPVLEQQIHESGLEHKVMLLGFIDENVLPALYHACDIFCLSSIQKTEAFGIAQIEAMSCAKPVIATNIPGSGVSWVNANGVSGLNVEPGNAREMANAIIKVLSDENVYRSFSENSYRRYRSMFTEEKMIDNCFALYEKIFNSCSQDR